MDHTVRQSGLAGSTKPKAYSFGEGHLVHQFRQAVRKADGRASADLNDSVFEFDCNGLPGSFVADQEAEGDACFVPLARGSGGALEG